MYAIVYEDPAKPDAPACVVHPSEELLEMAIQGGKLLHVEELMAARRGEAFDESRLADPMTREEAMEWALVKCVPPSVWGGGGSNRRRFAFVKTEHIPKDRTFRNAWRLEDL